MDRDGARETRRPRPSTAGVTSVSGASGCAWMRRTTTAGDGLQGATRPVPSSDIIRRRMGQRLPDLVGRAMIDPEFLEELRRSPDAVLAQYELTEEEGAVVRQALGRLGQGAVPQQIDELKNALLRRVST